MLALQAAAVAPAPATAHRLTAAELAAIGAAAGAAAAAAGPPARAHDHSKDFYSIETWDVDQPKLPTADFVCNLESCFTLKGTPDMLRCTLVLEKFEAKALGRFKSFTNCNSDTGYCSTTGWAKFRLWMLSALTPDALVESNQLEKQYLALEQKGSAERFADSYRELVSKIKNNLESTALHTDASLICCFVMKLKPAVRVFLVDLKFATLDDAIAQAILKDNIVFEMHKGTATPPPKRP